MPSSKEAGYNAGILGTIGYAFAADRNELITLKMFSQITSTDASEMLTSTRRLSHL